MFYSYMLNFKKIGPHVSSCFIIPPISVTDGHTARPKAFLTVPTGMSPSSSCSCRLPHLRIFLP